MNNAPLVALSYDLIDEKDCLENPFFFEFFENFNSEFTKRSYRTDINQFFKFLNKNNFRINKLNEVKKIHSISFKKWLTDNEYAPKSINRKFSALSSFFDYLIEKSLVETNPFYSVKRPKQTVKKPTNDLSDEQITNLLNVIESSTNPARLMHRAVIYLLFTTGIRKSELINLKRKDYYISKENSLIKIKAKGGKVLIKALHPNCVLVIDEYLAWMSRIDREVHEEDWIFQPSKNPLDKNNLIKPLNPKSVDFIIKSYCKRAGILDSISPHSARASYIGSALENGADLYKVSRDVGHSSVKTTEGYDKRRKSLKDSPIHHLGFLKD